MLFSGIKVGGTTYVVPNSVRAAHGTKDGAAKEWNPLGGIPLATSPGGPIVARLTFDYNSQEPWKNNYFRLWSDGTFGPIMKINRPVFVANPQSAVSGTFTLRNTGGASLATRVVNYRFAPGIAALPQTSSEWNGPYGRWYVGSNAAEPTPLNWPAGIAISGQPGGAHKASVAVPAGRAANLYVALVDIAGLPIPRNNTAINLAWSPSGAGRPTSAAGTSTWRTVSVTLPRGTYSVKATGTCDGACRFDYKPQALNPASSSVTAFQVTAPGAPTGLVATAGDRSASVAFVAPANTGGAPLSNYKFSIDNGATWVTRSPASVGSPIVISGLTNARTYLVKLKAVNSAGDGAASVAVAVTPKAPPPPPPVYKPDAAIRAVGGGWVGEGVFGTTAAGQSLSAAIPLGASRQFEVKVTNGGTAADTFGLADARGGPNAGAFSYAWQYQGVDVTSKVHNEGWFVLPNVPVGALRTLQLTVTAQANAPVGASALYSLHAYHSPTSVPIKDVVALQLTTVAAQGGNAYVRPAGAPWVPIQACSRWASPTGNDANPGTKASPVLSLSRLTAVLAPGQTGCLADNTTIELPEIGGFGVMSGGSLGKPKIIRPETPGARATVRGIGKFLVGANQSDLIIKDVDFRGSPTVGGGNLVQINGDRIMLDGVDISWPRNICLGVGAADGAFAEDFVLIDSRIHDCGATYVLKPGDSGAHGAYIQFVRDGGDADQWGAIVYNSLFDHNNDRGIQLFPDADNVLIDRVVMYGNGSNLNIGSMSAAQRSEGNHIRNSIMANSRLNFDAPFNANKGNSNDVVGNFPSEGNNGANNKIINSCLSNTVRPGLLFAAGGSGNVVLENVTQNQPPTFVDVARRDFRLAANSTCQGMGLADIAKLPPR